MEAVFLLTAVWLGILTSVSPCPLATNIAAVSFISRRITQRSTVFLSGILYTLGRSLTYIVLGVLIVKTLVDVPILSDFLQRYINKILGIVLILIGMVLLDLLRIPLSLPSVSENIAKKLVDKGALGSVPLGILFALAFCPVSAALFFGGLIPIAVKAQSGIGLPSDLWHRNRPSGPAFRISSSQRAQAISTISITGLQELSFIQKKQRVLFLYW